MKQVLKAINRRMARVTGWRLARSPQGGATPPPDYRALQFHVPVVDCISGYGFSYDTAAGYHPLVTLLKEHALNPALAYAGSSLEAFYERFVPESLQEAILGRLEHPGCPTGRLPYTHGYNKLRVPALPLPWSTPPQIRDYLQRRYDDGGSLGGDGHFRRTVQTLQSIRAHGFDPGRHSDGSLRHAFIRVVILRDGNEERYVIHGGQHRVAALAVLGWQEVPVVLEHHLNGTAPVVDVRNAGQWPVVRMGVYGRRAGERIFEALFSDRGWSRQRHFDLVVRPRDLVPAA